MNGVEAAAPGRRNTGNARLLIMAMATGGSVAHAGRGGGAGGVQFVPTLEMAQ
jgi:hypothetical protein